MKKSNECGQALVEVALSLSLLLLMVMAVIDFGYMLSSQVTLQNAVRQAGRYAITGQCMTGTNGSCSASRYNSIIATLEYYSVGLINSSNVGDISITCTNKGGGCPNGAGGPGDIITISVAYPYPFLTPLVAPFFPNQSHTINVSASFVNETFPPSQS